MVIRMKGYCPTVAIVTLLSSQGGNKHTSIPHQNQRRDVTQYPEMFAEQDGIGECGSDLQGRGLPNT